MTASMGLPNGHSEAFRHSSVPLTTPSHPDHIPRRKAIVPNMSPSDAGHSDDDVGQHPDLFLERARRDEQPERGLEDYPHAAYGLTAEPMPGGHGDMELLGVFEDEAWADDAAMAFEPANATLQRMFVVDHSEDHGLRSVWIWHDERGTMHMSMTVRRPVSDWHEESDKDEDIDIV